MSRSNITHLRQIGDTAGLSLEEVFRKRHDGYRAWWEATFASRSLPTPSFESAIAFRATAPSGTEHVRAFSMTHPHLANNPSFDLSNHVLFVTVNFEWVASGSGRWLSSVGGETVASGGFKPPASADSATRASTAR